MSYQSPEPEWQWAWRQLRQRGSSVFVISGRSIDGWHRQAGRTARCAHDEWQQRWTLQFLIADSAPLSCMLPTVRDGAPNGRFCVMAACG